MSPAYDTSRQSQSGPEDLASVVVLGFCALVGVFWYVAVSRLHLRNSQCLEISLDVAVSLFGFVLVLSHLIGRWAKREETWPHPAITIPGSKDARIVEDANRNLATVLGYNVHREPS